jgi:uncharacterized protein YlaI
MLLSVGYRYEKSKWLKNNPLMLLLCHDVGPTIEENIREHLEALISSVGPNMSKLTHPL